jgi:hypothetical protein
MSGSHQLAAHNGADLRLEIDRLKAATPLPAIIGQHVTLARRGRLHTGLCPFHGENTPSFNVYEDHYHCFGCGAHGDVFDWLTHHRGLSMREAVAHLGGDCAESSSGPKLPTVTMPSVKPIVAQPPTLDFARRIWSEAVPAAGTIVEAYLASRGLRFERGLPMKFHPACPRDFERLPAMLFLMTDPISAAPSGVHRTFLRPDGSGKAEGTAKMMAGAAGVIRLVPDEEVCFGIGIAEGIETSLSIMRHAGWRPVWACCSTGGIAKFPVLQGIDSITIFPDADDKGAGLKAARECAERWRGANREVTLRVPPAGCDWNDVARRAA